MHSGNIVVISDRFLDSHWTMYIDLLQLNEDIGRKAPEEKTGKLVTVYPVPKVKKLFKLIVTYATDEQIADIDYVITDHCKKLLPYWMWALTKRK